MKKSICVLPLSDIQLVMPKKYSTGSDKFLKSSTRCPSTSPSELSDCHVAEVELSEEEKRERYEKYQLTGDFEKDFLHLASLSGIEMIISHRAKFHHWSIKNEANRTKDDKNNLITADYCELKKEAPSSSHLVKKKGYEYLKAHVEIGTEWETHKEYVKELYMRGWPVGCKVIAVMSKTLPVLERLTVVNMWNVGLTDETLLCLGKCLQSSSSLKTLVLDGNKTVIGQRYDVFLNETDKICLENLSLRNCSLTETAASYIGDALTSNTTLLTLNLCFNQIGDLGAKYLAKSLHINRTLLSLNLGTNEIHDQGVKYISEAISTFSLTHEQVIARRKKFISVSEEKCNSLAEAPQPPNHNVTVPHVEHVSKDKHAPKKTSSKDKLTAPRLKSGTKREKSASADSTRVQKVVRQTSDIKNERSRIATRRSTEDTFVFNDPLLEKAREIGGQLWIPGNRSLINLNVSRNKITKVGVEMLYSAIKFQVDLARQHKRVTGVGLLRLCVKCKHFSVDDPTYIALSNVMNMRDPLYKPSPMTNSKDGATQS